MKYPSMEARDLALWAAQEKVDTFARVTDSRSENRIALAAVAEACWWLASLDEDLQNVHKKTYLRAREVDSRGSLLLGIRWARHRHSHDLITTSRGDIGPAFSYDPDSVVFISDPYRWRSVESMHLSGKSAIMAPDQRQRYVEALEGHPVLPTLEHALSWLTDAVEAFSRPA